MSDPSQQRVQVQLVRSGCGFNRRNRLRFFSPNPKYSSTIANARLGGTHTQLAPRRFFLAQSSMALYAPPSVLPFGIVCPAWMLSVTYSPMAAIGEPAGSLAISSLILSIIVVSIQDFSRQ